MNIISNDGSNKLNSSRKARVSYKGQRPINASPNAATSTRAVSSNPNFVTRQKIEIIYGESQNGRSLNELNRGQRGLETFGLFSNLTHDFLRSEERFSRNAETDLVCRLLLEKKKSTSRSCKNDLRCVSSVSARLSLASAYYVRYS